MGHAGRTHYSLTDMPRMKADSKGPRALNLDNAALLATAAAMIARLVALVFLLPLPVWAGDVVIEAMGGKCDLPPEAPVGADGIEYRDGWSDFVVAGRVVPSAIGLGIGLRLRLMAPLPQLEAVVQAPDGETFRWPVTPDAEGRIDFGHLPAYGEALAPGVYRLGLTAAGLSLLATEITVEMTAAGEDPGGLCLASVS